MSTGENAHRVYRFGEFSLDLDRETLFRGHREVHLRPKAFRVLEILLENNGRLVSKAELHEAAWQQSVVTDDSLAHCVADIRHALGDSDFEIIKTVPRRGYVFDHAVSRAIEDPSEPPPGRDRFAYHAGAIAAGLVAAILLLLGAGHGGDAPAAPSAGGEAVVALETGPSSSDIVAQNEYEKGRFFFKRRGQGDIGRAEASFRAALERDAAFAEAWIGLAGVYCVRISNGTLARETGLPLLGDATRHAIRLAPDSAEAHARRATYYQSAGEPLLALEHMETALALDPDDLLVLGYLAGSLLHHGRFDEAIKLQRRAIEGDPTSVLHHHNLVWFLLAAGRLAEAEVVAEQYHGLYPAGINDERSLFVDVQLLQGNYEQALVLTRALPGGPARDRNLAIIHHALGQQAKADAALQRLLDSSGEEAAIHAAEVLAHRGETDAAIEWLTDVLESPERDEPSQNRLWKDTLWLLSPYLIALRADERWQALYDDVIEARGQPQMLAFADKSRPGRRDARRISP